jgi:hypothetical protein
MNEFDVIQKLHYQKGYKYQITRDISVQTKIKPSLFLSTSFISLDTDGLLTCYRGYAWDGATMCPDFDWIIRGSMFHDAGYQLMRLEMVSQQSKLLWDELLKDCCLEDGAWKWQAAIVEAAVNKFGGKGASPNSRRQELVAPA